MNKVRIKQIVKNAITTSIKADNSYSTYQALIRVRSELMDLTEDAKETGANTLADFYKRAAKQIDGILHEWDVY